MEHTIAVGPNELVYDVWNPEAGGAPLVLLHGMTGCAGDFAHAGGDRIAAGRRAALLDARGHGRSSPVAGATHRERAEDLLAVLDHLGVGEADAVGVRMGGRFRSRRAR